MASNRRVESEEWQMLLYRGDCVSIPSQFLLSLCILPIQDGSIVSLRLSLC